VRKDSSWTAECGETDEFGAGNGGKR